MLLTVCSLLRIVLLIGVLMLIRPQVSLLCEVPRTRVTPTLVPFSIRETRLTTPGMPWPVR